jgi:exopolysaccharide biosynthesis WecB/TagA/CpsF family protein
MSLARYNLAHRARPTATVAQLPVETSSLADTANFFIDYCLSEARRSDSRPLYSTSVNGHVISLCARDRALRGLFERADSINADGQPMVSLSRWLARNPIAERVATTDLFPEVARLAAEAGVTFYVLGASEAVNKAAVAATLRAHPKLRIVGRRNGYFSRDEEAGICAEIAALKPDILWVSLGVPLEQQFCVRNLERLTGVGIVKTAGGLFDFVSLAKPRAPQWMQRIGLEWLFRLAIEPRRLFVRYAISNPHALFVMLRSMR